MFSQHKEKRKQGLLYPLIILCSSMWCFLLIIQHFSIYQVGFWTYPVKCAVTSHQESTTIFSHATDAPAFLKDPFAETDNTFVKLTRKVLVL